MKRNEFLALCCENLVDPDVALENDAVSDALRRRDDKAVRRLMLTEF